MKPAARPHWQQALARLWYTLLLRGLLPAMLLRLWWRGLQEPGYRQAVGERLGLYRRPCPLPGALWLHAVSLGETRAAAPLIDALRAQRPGLRLLLTHGTATGRAAGAALLKPGDRQAWLPLDTPGATRRFFAHFKPVLGVLMETEVWPNLQRAARRAQVPVVLANARLSERSLARGRRLAALMQPAAASLTRVLAQTAEDARRLSAFGASPVEVCGNLKFDITPAPSLLAKGKRWRRLAGRPVVVAASFREGEDRPLLLAWLALPAPRPLLLLVPRHPQRFDEVADQVKTNGLRLSRRSAWADLPPPLALQSDVWLGDSLGEMALYYGTADVALLGGSFAPLGGQNLIEAAACGCPVLMGPHTFNFAQAAELALEAGAAERLADLDAAVVRAAALVRDPSLADRAAQARNFARAHRGATERTAQRLLGFLDRG